ncbi:calcium/sodium antiporter [Demequina pelophila]|uniref:calcium/sodium antiporter n=1 Tax=Demequina pelophila TaxID=1638984 RepID=UPI0007805C11|nr:calcium/sodium antiporter [Demequina pelophila]
MALAILATLLGLALVAWSADKFVDGAAAVAQHLGMAPLLVGMVIIGFGTSAPELAVSAFAAADGEPGLALGNAIGSNIANIGLILGATAIVMPIAVRRGVLRSELPFVLLVTVLLAGLLVDRHLSRADAMILVAVLVGYLAWSIWRGTRREDAPGGAAAPPGGAPVDAPGAPPADAPGAEPEPATPASSADRDPLVATVVAEEERIGLSKKAAWTWTLVGMALLIVASRVLVWGATGIAERLGWSELVIGLTVVAIGTSAPELAAGLAAARRGAADLVLGNVIGSNLFNALGVVGLAGLIAPTAVEDVALTRDIPALLVITVALILMAYHPRRDGRINRIEGGVLLVAWIGYTVVLIATAG